MLGLIIIVTVVLIAGIAVRAAIRLAHPTKRPDPAALWADVLKRPSDPSD